MKIENENLVDPQNPQLNIAAVSGSYCVRKHDLFALTYPKVAENLTKEEAERIKNEMFYGRSWDGVSVEEFIQQLNRCLEWYNERRIKISLGSTSPMEYRRSLGLVS